MAPDATEIIAEGENSDREEDAEPGKFSDPIPIGSCRPEYQQRPRRQ
jgi:hypothetical protein